MTSEQIEAERRLRALGYARPAPSKAALAEAREQGRREGFAAAMVAIETRPKTLAEHVLQAAAKVDSEAMWAEALERAQRGVRPS